MSLWITRGFLMGHAQDALKEQLIVMLDISRQIPTRANPTKKSWSSVSPSAGSAPSLPSWPMSVLYACKMKSKTYFPSDHALTMPKAFFCILVWHRAPQRYSWRGLVDPSLKRLDGSLVFRYVKQRLPQRGGGGVAWHPERHKIMTCKSRWCKCFNAYQQS